MKVIFCADIHRDAGSADERISNIVNEKPNILVHCGDLSSWGEYERSLIWLRKLFPKTEILLIPGNHEFYCNKRQTIREIIDLQTEKNIQYDIFSLNNNNYKISDNFFIVGCMGWYDYSFPADKKYTKQELDAGSSRGIQWNDMRSINTDGKSNKYWSDLFLSFLITKLASLSNNSKIIYCSHFLPYHELNAHAPSLFGAYSGSVEYGKILNSLGDRLIKSFCGHTHKEAKFNKHINIGSDYYGSCKYYVEEI